MKAASPVQGKESRKRPALLAFILAASKPSAQRGFALIEHYYVLVDGSKGCQYRHKDLASAYTEARRIFAQQGESRRVFVLQSIGVIEPAQEAAVLRT